MTLQTLPAGDQGQTHAPGNVGGFSLHAGVAIRANQRNKRERLCRYIARPALSEHRLSLTAAGKVRYQLKTPYNNGTTHVVFEPLDFMAKLAALVPGLHVLRRIRFSGEMWLNRLDDRAQRNSQTIAQGRSFKL